jgi:cell division protein FtsL
VRSEQQHIGEIYAARAMEEVEPTPSSISIPKIREARDMVYNGAAELSNDRTGSANILQASRNRKEKKRRISPFTVILLLLGGAVSIVLYIGNILTVGYLIVQINLLQTKHQQIVNEQELLKAQINRLSGLERIQQLAHDQLGLQNPKQLPVWIEIDPERLDEVEEVFQQQVERKR